MRSSRIEETDMKAPITLAIALALGPLLATAQSTIYQSNDKSGPVFSDTPPSPGATPIELKPLNVIETPKIAPSAASQDAAPAAYNQLLITSPANDDTIWVGAGNVQLQIFLQPPLNSTMGDTLQVSVNGNVQPRGYTTNSISIPTERFTVRDDSDSIEQTVQVAVVSTTGKVLIQSPPVRLYLRRHIQYNRATPR